jgi:hypothetical protein
LVGLGVSVGEGVSVSVGEGLAVSVGGSGVFVAGMGVPVGAGAVAGGRVLGAADCDGSAVPDAHPVTIIDKMSRTAST